VPRKCGANALIREDVPSKGKIAHHWSMLAHVHTLWKQE
jgi:hypothetical protein